MQLDGSHALVTGASHGIGIEIVREFRARGARVTALGRDKGRLVAICDELGAHPLVVDLADPDALAQVIGDAERDDGPVDVLINNAGLAYVAPAARSEAGMARQLMLVNAVAPMELCRQVLPGMLERGRGNLVNVSSLAGVSAVPDMSLYSASKAALHHYTSTAQRELPGTGVTMSLVTLGEVAGTYMMEQARQSPVIDAVSKRLAHVLPILTPQSVARGIADVVEQDTKVATIPRRLGVAVTLRNLPSTLQDLAFIGIPR
ncbi:SDR family NAD(P)-dependent oxidoreductase [Pseudonocardia sp. GCM10023141]|uniref:SDR family NAD(P)-dependent oxidoreductase n=1 Tax=Pseudonocardia sp. GCM10023141 TaxID=3252653 RepID=UPI00360817FD